MLVLAAPYWQKAGWDQVVVGTGSTMGPFADRLRDSGFEALHCPLQGKFDRTLFALLKLIKKAGPDVVHVHTEGNSALLATGLRACGLPVVRTVHNSFPYSRRLRVQKICERALERLVGSRMIAISKSVFSNELERLWNRTTLCWNWFDDQRFRPPAEDEREAARRGLGLLGSDFVLVSVGNGNDIKNYPAIIEAIPLLRRELHPERTPRASGASRILYLMVGNEHPSGIEREAAQKWGVMDSVRFCGPQRDVLPFLWAADAFLMPSKYEGFGLSAVEALATGIPCVFSDCPGLRDFRDFPFQINWSGCDALSIAAAVSPFMTQATSTFRLEDTAAAVRQEFGVERRSAEYTRIWNAAAGIS